MSTPITTTTYGKYVDLQNYLGSAPQESGSIYLSGSDASEKLYTNVGWDVVGASSFEGSVTSDTAFVIGNASLNEADMEKLDGITDGTAAANKALVLDADGKIATITQLSASYFSGSTLVEAKQVSTDNLDAVVPAGSSIDGAGTFDFSAGTLTLAADQISGDKVEGGTIAAITITDASITTLASAMDCDSQAMTNLNVDSGAMDGTVVGANSAAAGTFTTLTATTSVLGTLGGNVDHSNYNSTNVDIDSGAMDGTTIGASSAAAGTFTTLTATTSVLGTLGGNVDHSNYNSTNVDIDSGAIDGTTIGANSAAAANFTTVEASGDATFNGNIAGDNSTNISGISQLTASYAKIDILDVNEINSVTRTETTLEVVDKLILAGSGSASADADGGGLQIGGSVGSGSVASILYDHTNAALEFNIAGTAEMRLEDGKLLPNADDNVDLGETGLEFKDLHLDGVAYIDELRADTLGAALDCDSQAMTNLNVDSGAMDGTVVGANSAAAGTFTTLTATTSVLGTLGGNVDHSNYNSTNVDIDSGAIDGTTIGASSQSSGRFTTLSGSGAVNFASTLTVEGNFETSGSVDAGGSGTFDSLTVDNASDLNSISMDGAFVTTSTMSGSGTVSFAGKIGMAGVTAPSYAIDVANGSANANKIRAAAFVTYSDEKLKTNVTPMADAVGTIMKLQGVTFDWKDGSKNDLGFIAQDVAKVVPQVVHTGDDRTAGVDYARLTSILVEAVKSQQVEIGALKDAIANLKK